MLKSKFTKKSGEFRARKIFTDRVEPREAFRRSLDAFETKPCEVLVYYGKGGIGKSSLIKSLYSEDYKPLGDYKLHSIFVSLDAYDFANPVNILMAIRNGIQGDCGLFDYALLQYCARARMSVDEIMNRNSVLSSPVMDVLNEVISLGTSSALIPTAILSKCAGLIRDLRFRARYKEEIDELSELNEFEIFERLPHYLGLCIGFAAEKGDAHVIFLDSYESLLARTSGATPSVEREEWLQELVLSSEVLRVVIASRDRLRWDRYEPDWAEYLDQHLLENLSAEDSTWFLEQVPISDPEAVRAIVRDSGGVPLYLDMCVDIYEAGVNDGTGFKQDPHLSGSKIIQRYIRHLSDRDKSAVAVLSMLKSFDAAFASKLLMSRNLAYGEDELQELFDRSVFLPTESRLGLMKVDESVRAQQRSEMSASRKGAVAESILGCILSEPDPRSYPYLSAVLEAVAECPECLPPLLEKCVQAVELYASMGFWNELGSLLAPDKEDAASPLYPIAVFAELIRLRRTASLSKAEEFAETHPLDPQQLGVWHYMYRYLKIQIRHLLGHYDEALSGYSELCDELELIKSVVPQHIYVLISTKYADLLFLKGGFERSLEVAERLLMLPDLGDGDRIELLRIKGHIYRFRRQYREALVIYGSALRLAEKGSLRAYLGKLYTNMAEASCVTEPERALEWFEKSEQTNSAVDNGIELGKALAAASAAYTKLGDTAKGEEYARRAISAAEETGYRSGKAFALITLHYALRSAGREAEAETVRDEIVELVSELGVYEYLAERVM